MDFLSAAIVQQRDTCDKRLGDGIAIIPMRGDALASARGKQRLLTKWHSFSVEATFSASRRTLLSVSKTLSSLAAAEGDAPPASEDVSEVPLPQGHATGLALVDRIRLSEHGSSYHLTVMTEEGELDRGQEEKELFARMVSSFSTEDLNVSSRTRSNGDISTDFARSSSRNSLFSSSGGVPHPSPSGAGKPMGRRISSWMGPSGNRRGSSLSAEKTSAASNSILPPQPEHPGAFRYPGVV
ncbi:hypothetical protein T484DRAFT_1817997 [Baffinella frigidus]|nr:hypothetical protein T484DRAFT_1817997 [Cryptophyta sp. CCMP2293]